MTTLPDCFALNALGLDTQVPARHVYVSSGPYKSYEYGPYRIELRHRANRDLLDCSETTCAIVQALKALGKDGVGSEVTKALARNLTVEQVDAFREDYLRACARAGASEGRGSCPCL